MTRTLRALIVEDDEDDALLVTHELKLGGYDVSWERVDTRAAMAAALDRGPWDLIVSDFRMPQFSATAALALYRERGLDTPFILVSGTIGEEQAVASIRAGAHDFFLKDRLVRLCTAVERQLAEAENRRTRREAEAAREASIAALARSEARLARMIEFAPDAMVISDANGAITLVNAQAERLFGYRRDELLGRPVELLVPERLRDRRREHRTRAPEELRVRPLGTTSELLGRRKDGAEIPVEIVLSPLETDEGQLVWAAIRDVSERVRMEATLHANAEALRQNELRLALALSTIDMAVYQQDRDLVYTWMFRPQLGDAAEEVVGKTDAELLPPDAARQSTEIKRWALESGAPARGEVSVVTDGQERNYDVVVEPRRDADGKIVGITGASLDVTGRRRAEEAIVAERAFSEATLDGLPGVFLLFDESGRFLRWNRALETLSGYTTDQIRVMHPLDFFPGEDQARAEESIRRVFESGSAEAELALVTRDGRRIPHYFSGLRFVVDGVPSCIGMGIDLTARKLLEAELQQAQKIEAIGRLAGGVAHDFNNILGVILGYGELALSEVAADDPVRERVEEMVKAAERAAGLTRQLQAFSRKQIFQLRLLDLNAQVAEAHKMLERLIGEDVRLVSRLAPDLGSVRADPGQIDQILMNLAVNARDAMPLGGNLTIETANIDLHADYASDHPPVTPGQYAMLAVSDTGAGMDAETQRRIFEPFFTTKPVGEGTGLGLATVYGIVKQSGGYIWVYSEPGHGTTFKVYLPRVGEPAESGSLAGPPASAPRGGESVLVVEDSAALSEVVRENLAGLGYTVLFAADGEQALSLARAHDGPIHLLLTDVVMPKLGGGELARQLLALRPELRVIFMSGYTDGAISHHGVLEEGVVLLVKPFTRDQLARAVRSTLDHR